MSAATIQESTAYLDSSGLEVTVSFANSAERGPSPTRVAWRGRPRLESIAPLRESARCPAAPTSAFLQNPTGCTTCWLYRHESIDEGCVDWWKKRGVCREHGGLDTRTRN